ncbi:MAG: hypothetical protein IJF83_10925 [Methanobrevibacter sp.]|nr:hypothetical protein [Methanobrevibacter sp.]
MNRLEVQMCLIDQEINQLISRKNLIDIRLSELYEQREDVVTEWENQEAFVKNCYSLNCKMTRKELQKVVEELKNGDL